MGRSQTAYAEGTSATGVTPEGIRHFLDELGVIRGNSMVDSAMLDHSIRQDLKDRCRNAMAVMNPLKVIITNVPEDRTEMLSIPNHEHDEVLGMREVPFSRELYIEREDFMEEPEPGFHRLSPGKEVRLKGAYFIKCEHVVKDPATGDIMEIHCTYDPLTKSGSGFKGRKVKSTLHWVSAKHGIPAELRLYDTLLKESAELLESDNIWADLLNPDSLIRIKDAILEPSMKEAAMNRTYQFIRHGYFCLDSKHATEHRLVFNRVVSLKDSWKKTGKN